MHPTTPEVYGLEMESVVGKAPEDRPLWSGLIVEVTKRMFNGFSARQHSGCVTLSNRCLIRQVPALCDFVG
jgi:hypothetical protein